MRNLVWERWSYSHMSNDDQLVGFKSRQVEQGRLLFQLKRTGWSKRSSTSNQSLTDRMEIYSLQYAHFKVLVRLNM